MPVPDPTILTTQALYREIAALKELLQLEIGAVAAIAARNTKRIDELPMVLDDRYKAVMIISDERLHSIREQFATRDVAVKAAFEAQEKSAAALNIANSTAVTKSESAVTKQIEQQGTLINTLTASAESKISDAKDRIAALENRVVSIEGKTAGNQESKQGQNTNNTLIVSVIAIGISLIGLIMIAVNTIARFATASGVTH